MLDLRTIADLYHHHQHLLPFFTAYHETYQWLVYSPSPSILIPLLFSLFHSSIPDDVYSYTGVFLFEILSTEMFSQNCPLQDLIIDLI